MSRNVQHGQEVHQGPLSYSGFLDFFLGRVERGNASPVHVQFRKRGEVFCGTVLEAAPGQGDTDWIRVDSSVHRGWVPHKNVRLCSGDGRCRCEADAGQDALRAAAPASASVPLGNTGTTTVAGA